ncbi:MAG: hypothetical protein EOR72_20320 [Mesorhizobium sp.]|uniref:hypothetical protein n=1 Tax=Mesorhizobium sp. TaxID=1871066 RepID=UPI000FE6375A|nr:hypothetical protein [Mesorhizobium sp.]RWM12869.1 MAG: hypothetical protein EOR72_20320 [Mesorhizobium sp.]
MSHEYTAQSHDWDLTLHAAGELVRAGLAMDKKPRSGSLSMGFSFFTGGMVLAFAAIESFSASVAFAMQSEERFAGFEFQAYRARRAFWDKMELLMSAAGIEVDKSRGLFRDIGQMQQWRNLVTHSSPYEVGPTEIADTIKAPGRLHRKTMHRDFARMADPENATKFYNTAVAYIDLLKARTGLEPHTSSTYRQLG